MCMTTSFCCYHCDHPNDHHIKAFLKNEPNILHFNIKCLQKFEHSITVSCSSLRLIISFLLKKLLPLSFTVRTLQFVSINMSLMG